MDNENIFGLIINYRNNYKTRTIKIADGYEFNQYQRLTNNELYYNSKFETGDRDSQGVTKAFYNIGKSRVQVEVRATDLDQKDMDITTQDVDYFTKAMLFSKENRKWMKQARFGIFLNDLGETSAKHGGVLVKKTEPNGILNIDVVGWKYLTTDQTDILSGIIIEESFYTPSQLLKMSSAGWSNLNEAVQSAKENKDSDYNQGSTPTQGAYVQVYEIHGELPEYFLEDDPMPPVGEIKYCRQMHIIANPVESTDLHGKKTYSGTTLFKGKEKTSPYKYYCRQKINGRGLGIGVMEDVEQAQLWTNKAVNDEKKVMEIAGKIILQQQGVGSIKNILSDVDNGQILDNKGKPISQVFTTPSSLPQFQNIVEKWDKQAERVTSTFASVTGETLPSGTPYRLGAILNQEANSQFEYLRENMGLFIQEIYMDWVFPYLTKKLKDEHTLVADFTVDELALIDQSFVNFEVNQKIKEVILNGGIVSPYQIDQMKTFYGDFITKTKNKRGLTIPKGYYDGVEYQLDILITNEQKMKAVYLETLSNILTTVAQNPNVLTDPKLSQIFNEIMQVAGFNSERLSTIANAKSPNMLANNTGSDTLQNVNNSGQIGKVNVGEVATK